MSDDALRNKMEAREQAIADWNAAFDVGQLVDFYPVRPASAKGPAPWKRSRIHIPFRSKTRSKAFMATTMDPVVFLAHKSGYVHLDHVCAIHASSPPAVLIYPKRLGHDFTGDLRHVGIFTSTLIKAMDGRSDLRICHDMIADEPHVFRVEDEPTQHEWDEAMYVFRKAHRELFGW